ncbi:MAG TPA: phosphoethanolamine--lipid A transferase [Cellvibrio sp.]|nr:phosphoethanolamine--lipid A transferase [Cellvibrio sp.]
MAFPPHTKSSPDSRLLDYRPGLFSRSMSSSKLAIILSCVFILFYNPSFFHSLFATIELLSIKDYFFAASIILFAATVTALTLSLLILPGIAKPVIMLMLICAAGASYFMNNYGISVHKYMIQNVLETDLRELKSLFNSTLALYILLLGIAPCILLARVKLQFGSWQEEAVRKLKFLAGSAFILLVLLMCFSADYASFFRNDKQIRQKINPVNIIYASIHHLFTSNKSFTVAPIGEDAALNSLGQSLNKPVLLILVVGETARADRFSINGYEKPTTPLLAQQNIINYSQVSSCGTETAVSVPCMFSALGRSDYSDKKAKSQQGLLDILKRGGYSVLWRDNNSGCKGTCDRVEFENLSNAKVPEFCNERECFDNILLHELDKKAFAMRGSKVIVLHQKGSHGPDYYRRYPKDMEVFKPVCRVNKLQDCSAAELNNAFDNTIHYTDLFLNNTIEWLKNHTDYYNTALIYLSDHGESLGEDNLYLHGMPYMLAPKEQKHIPFLFWFSDDFSAANKINSDCMRALSNEHYSQDNLFHTALGLLNITTSLYQSNLDMAYPCREH